MASITVSKILVVVAIVLTVLAALAWIVFLGGFAYETNDSDPNSEISDFTGPIWDPYWVVSVLSPFLAIAMIAQGVLMLLSDKLGKFFFFIHILVVLAFVSTVIVLCFLGWTLVDQRRMIQNINDAPQFLGLTVPEFRIALFSGALLEVFFLGGAWTCYILALLFGGLNSRYNL